MKLERNISLEWIIDKLWPIAWMLAGGYLTAAYVGALSIFQDYQGASYILLFFLGGLGFIGLYYLINRVKMQRLSIKSAELALSESNANPLESSFDRKTIKISDFYDPFYIGHTGKTFTDCRIEGPGLLYIPDSSLFGLELRHCQIVIVKPNVKMFGVTVFSRSSISGGSICNCTVLMTRDNYNQLPDLHNKVLVISE